MAYEYGRRNNLAYQFRKEYEAELVAVDHWEMNYKLREEKEHKAEKQRLKERKNGNLEIESNSSR